MPSTTSRSVGAACGLAGAVLFGANGSLTKAVMASGLTPMQVTQFRTLAMAVLAGLVLLVADRGAFRLSRGRLWRMALLGIVGMAGLQTAYAAAIEALPVGIALLLEYLAVLAVAVIARVFFRERVRSRVWIAIVLVLGGIAVVSRAWAGALDAWGVAIGLVAAACLTFYFVYGERQISATSPLATAFWSALFATIACASFSGWWTLAPAAFAEPVSLQGNLAAIRVPMWVPLLGVMALGTFVPFVLSFVALRRLRATTAGILASSEVVFAFVVAWVWLGEMLDWLQILGGAAVLVGIVLAQTARPHAAADPDLAVASEPVSALTGPVPRVGRDEPST